MIDARRKQPKRWVLVCLAIGLLAILAAWFYLRLGLPNIHRLADYTPAQKSQVYAHDGTVMGEFYTERRTLVPLNAIPNHVVQAFLAAEDAHFYQHQGIDYLGVIRALIKNMRPGAHLQGASTITQQTVKTLILGPERSYTRKIRELLLARELEQTFSKQDILFIYLNQIYFGSGAWGIEEAAQTYFGTSVSNLSLAQAALLAGIPKNPSRYNIKNDITAALARQRYVLNQMQANGFVDAQDLATALAESASIAPPPTRPLSNPDAIDYVEHVRRLLIGTYGEKMVLEGGLKIYTAMRNHTQAAAKKALHEGIDQLSQQKNLAALPQLQGALVAIDPFSREVHAMIGGYNNTPGGFNRVTQALRQPGSAFKPILYATALGAQNITPASLCPDSPVVILDPWTGLAWKPENYEDGQYDGNITYRTALLRSKNTCSVRLIQKTGPEAVIATAHAMGINTPMPKNLTLALGTGSLNPLELTNAYSTIAAFGQALPPVFIRQVIGPERQILEESTDEEATQAITPQVAYVLTHMLQSVVQSGTGRLAKQLARPVAGKTGTSQQSRDAWFVGFSTDLVAGVWVGFDDNTSMKNQTGASAALPIWVNFMRDALVALPASEFAIPEGVTTVHIDSKTGFASETPDSVAEVFVEGTEPVANNAPTPRSIFLEDDDLQTLTHTQQDSDIQEADE